MCHGPESDLDPSRGDFPRDPDSAENDPSAEAVSGRPEPWVSDNNTDSTILLCATIHSFVFLYQIHFDIKIVKMI